MTFFFQRLMKSTESYCLYSKDYDDETTTSKVTCYTIRLKYKHGFHRSDIPKFFRAGNN